jgi:hypothetical protein
MVRARNYTAATHASRSRGVAVVAGGAASPTNSYRANVSTHSATYWLHRYSMASYTNLI